MVQKRAAACGAESSRQPACTGGAGRGVKTVTVVDVMAVSIENPQSAVRTFRLPDSPPVVECSVLIAGGGTGGVAAALACARRGLPVCLTEETDWLGGQLTAQGVSALDENRFVETSGAARSYQALRESIRAHYRARAASAAAGDPFLNPGKCWVSYLSFEPQVAVAKLEEMLAPAVGDGTLRIYRRCKAVSVRRQGKLVKSVLAVNLDSGETIDFRPRICLDATELGEIVALAGLTYRLGAESADATGEPHAPAAADRENVQDFTYPFALELCPGENHTIDKPAAFDFLEQSGKFSLAGYKMFQTAAAVDQDGRPRQLLPFWEYRRLIDRELFGSAGLRRDIAMINWESNDVRGQNFIDQPAAETAARLAHGKSVSLSFLYWLQTRAPRDEGGFGYPEFRLRPDIMGTQDGLSKYPYIRESRRIVALTTVVEQDIAAATNAGARARSFHDTVGIGLYPIDIHGHQEIPGAAQPAKPFQIPFGALIPAEASNLIACAKNIGTTHITNGAYRLHPVEWALGEAAGTAALIAIEHETSPAGLAGKRALLRRLQQALADGGAPTFWFDDVPTAHPDFAAIQFLTTCGVLPCDNHSLHFRPDDPLTGSEAAAALAAVMKGRQAGAAGARRTGIRSGLSEGREADPAEPIAWGQLGRETYPAEPVRRGPFASWLYRLARDEGRIGRF